MTQRTFLDDMRAESATRLDAAFAAFHADNPVVYEHLVRLARQAQARGRKKAGIRMLWEVMRWELFVGVDVDRGESPFKLNDHLTSRYARLIMEREPDLHAFFETRSVERAVDVE